MGRHRYRGARGSGAPNQRDTPLKAAPSRRDRGRRHNRHEDIPEEPEEAEPKEEEEPEEEEEPKQEEAEPVPLFTPPGSEAFAIGERPVLKVTRQNLTVTLESTLSPEEEEEEEEEEEDEDCYSSATSSSSLSSPEIFRRGSYVETLTSFKELLALQLHTKKSSKNSTLLDASHAESIRRHPSPDLSHITGASPTENSRETSKHRGPEAETRIHADPFKSEKWKTPPKLPGRRPLVYKKKVCFRSPVTAALLQPRRRDDATFFHFEDLADRHAFFRRMSARKAALAGAPLFPADVIEDEGPSAM